MAKPKTSMHEIASLAGVSLATVSRALNAPHMLREATLERVRQAMQEKGYVYNATAADLSRKQGRLLGVIVPTLDNFAFASTFLAIQQAAQQAGWSLMVGVTRHEPEAERETLARFRERRLAGMVVVGISQEMAGELRDIHAAGTPCVVIWDIPEGKLPYVGFDNYAASHAMTRHLLELGHRRIGMICGPYSRVERARKRLEGFTRALKDAGITLDPELVRESRPLLSAGKEGMRTLMGLKNPPTAVFAASDSLALGALAGARELGLCVPRDVSVAGFDDIDMAAYASPPLTTVRVPAREMGTRAVEMLSDCLSGGSGQSCTMAITLATEVIARESTGRPSDVPPPAFSQQSNRDTAADSGLPSQPGKE